MSVYRAPATGAYLSKILPEDMTREVLSFITPPDDILLSTRVFEEMIGGTLPQDIVHEITSYDGRSDYNAYYERYTWEQLKATLEYNVFHDVTMCVRLFKILEEIQDDMYVFYPNAASDPTIRPSIRALNATQKYQSKGDPDNLGQKNGLGVSFKEEDWFVEDFYRHPLGGKRWFVSDEFTNYSDIVNMVFKILKKADRWYWDYYTGSTERELRILRAVLDLYEELEKNS